MKSIFKKVIPLFCFLAFSSTAFGQNIGLMTIEKMENAEVLVPEQCSPEDMIVIINSSIPDLKFESNILPDSDFIVTYYENSNQFIICHEPEKFKLTISGPNLQSETIDIFDLSKPVAFRISAKDAKGTVNILTNPRNSKVTFPEYNNLEMSTNQPITMASGKYRVKIAKPGYALVDTIVTIPRDAEKTYNIEFLPLFARIKLDLTTDDQYPFSKTPVLWVDSNRIELDALVKPGLNQRSFFDNVEFFRFYEGNMIPVTEGKHQIKIEAESYIPYKSTVETKNGRVSIVAASLEPVFGYLTFVDKQFSEGAKVILDGKEVGKVPVFKIKSRVGTHKVKFLKPGFISNQEEYSVTVTEKQNTDIDVSMAVAKNITYTSEPTSAEVYMDGTRIGFTPFSVITDAGYHKIIVRKNDYAAELIYKTVNEKTPADDTVHIELRQNHPLSISSETKGARISLKGAGELESVEVDTGMITPYNALLPYGKYKVNISKDKRRLYRSSVIHYPEVGRQWKLPSYSRGSFHTLSFNIENEQSYEGSFGRIHIFPRTGLSTALLNSDYKFTTRITDSATYDFKTLAVYPFFLNWDWRIGGALLRQLDVSFLGRAKYTPGLKIAGLNIPGFTDMDMQNYFYGVDESTRISYLNINFRYGRQIRKGNIHHWDEGSGEYTGVNFGIDESLNMATVGITLNGKVSRSNNMLRLWNKPIVNQVAQKIAVFRHNEGWKKMMIWKKGK